MLHTCYLRKEKHKHCIPENSITVHRCYKHKITKSTQDNKKECSNNMYLFMPPPFLWFLGPICIKYKAESVAYIKLAMCKVVNRNLLQMK